MGEQPVDKLPLSGRQRIHIECEQFITAWKEHLAKSNAEQPQPELGRYLKLITGDNHQRAALLLELLDIDVYYRRETGQTPVREEYTSRLPEFAWEINAWFDEELACRDESAVSTERLQAEAVYEDSKQDVAAPAARLETEVSAPDQIGRYTVRKLIGRGTFGSVYLAYDGELDREVAIKLQRRRGYSASDNELYRKESRILADLKHEHIISVYDAGQLHDGRRYVVSELIDGTDLKEELTKGRMPCEETSALLASVAEALHYAHRKKLVHRDIKPANILIDSAGKPYVADFGLALADEDFGNASLPQGGTIAYMSPEQARMEGHLIDGRSDIFSLGAVMYEMLTGERPFAGKNSREVLDRIKTLEARPPRMLDDTIPPELERICLRAMSKRVSERYNTSLDMANALRSLLGDQIQGMEDRGEVKGKDEAQLANPVKGPMAFTPADGEVFCKLGRQNEVNKLVDYVTDDQICMVIVMGASGAGKTSLLRAGLTHALKDKKVPIHYWEANAKNPDKSLLHAVCQTWRHDDDGTDPPESLEALAGSVGGRRRVIVLDQFEQLAGRNFNECPVFGMLRKIIRESRAPHSKTWVIAFRREYRADWSDFFITAQNRRFYPAELSVKLFSVEHAKEVTKTLLVEAGISAEDTVVDDLVEASRNTDGVVSPVDIGIGNLMLSELQQRHPRKTIKRAMYRFAGGAEGLLETYIREQIGRTVHSKGEQSRLLTALLELRDPDQPLQRLADGLSCVELAKRSEALEASLQRHLEYFQQPNVRLLEKLSPQDKRTQPRYRLSHERLIPVLNSLGGVLLAQVKHAQLRLEAAFQAWQNNVRRQAYLLKGKDLRLVSRYISRIPLEKQAAEKREFFDESVRVRRRRFSFIGAIVCACIVASWLGLNEYKKIQHKKYLRDHGYPEELYVWKHQLKSLTLSSPMNFNDFSWLDSPTLEQLTVMSVRSGTTLCGLADARVPSLKELTLDLRNSQVTSVDELEALSGLTQLKLHLGGSEVRNLTGLKHLANLTQLTLDFGQGFANSQVKSLEGLESLTNLKQLTLYLSEGAPESLTELTELHALNELALDLGRSHVRSLDGLKSLTNLTQLTLHLGDGPGGFGSQVSTLAGLVSLNGLNQLTLHLDTSNVRSLDELKSLTNLAQLTLHLGDSSVKNLNGLESLGDLTHLNLDLGNKELSLDGLKSLTKLEHLTLHLGGRKTRGPVGLESLPSLTQLTLDLRGSEVSSLDWLTHLSGLTQLTLHLGDTNVSRLDGLESLTELTQLTLDFGGSVYSSKVASLDELESLKSLSKLTLLLGGSEVKSLAALQSLNSLTELTLRLESSHVENIKGLASMPSLTQLTLDLGVSEVESLNGLGTMTGLTQLTLNLSDSEVRCLDELQSLADLSKLTLYMDVSYDGFPLARIVSRSKVTSLNGLGALAGLTHLKLLASRKLVLSLTALPETVTHLSF